MSERPGARLLKGPPRIDPAWDAPFATAAPEHELAATVLATWHALTRP